MRVRSVHSLDATDRPAPPRHPTGRFRLGRPRDPPPSKAEVTGSNPYAVQPHEFPVCDIATPGVLRSTLTGLSSALARRQRSLVVLLGSGLAVLELLRSPNAGPGRPRSRLVRRPIPHRRGRGPAGPDPGGRIGLMWALTGLAWFGAALAPVLDGLYLGPLGHVIIAYPTGRVRRGLATYVVVTGYLGGFVVPFVAIDLRGLVLAMSVVGRRRPSSADARAPTPWPAVRSRGERRGRRDGHRHGHRGEGWIDLEVARDRLRGRHRDRRDLGLLSTSAGVAGHRMPSRRLGHRPGS